MTADAGPLTGRTLGDFTLGALLGEGAQGVVYQAAQRGLGREAVVKVPRARPGDAAAVAVFLREAQLASRLDHPYAAHVYAFGAEPDGVMWIAMELVRGTSLAMVLAVQPGGRMPVARWAGLLDRICEVVHTAHDQGIVHRDLKPENIMVLARAGRLLPKLLDLGIATLAGDVGGGGARAGTPAYMAPEQWRGEACDARTDVYALGVMSWEALTGALPFAGASLAELGHAHQAGPPPWPTELPAALGAAIVGALASDPAGRPTTALMMAEAVRAAAGLRLAADALPRLDDALRAEVAWLPQPIAEAVDALEGARNPHQARDALWEIVHVAARWLGVLALAARSQVGAGPGEVADAPAVIEALRALHRRDLADDEWVELARGLAGPFSRARDAYPVPELVDLARAEASPFAPLFALRAVEATTTSEESLREWLARTLPVLTPLIRALAFLTDYQLVVARDGGAEIWMGARKTRRAMMHVSGGRADEALLVDLDGRPVLALAPLVAIAAPAPGAPEELFLFAGAGRARGRGARLVAEPHGFERHDDEVWAWMRAHLFAIDDAAAARLDEGAPYRGLAAFTADDAAQFVGREREAQAFVNRLLVTPLLAVVGPSGAGKSSFVQAGVLPLLPAGWHAVVLRPGAAPMAALAAKLDLRVSGDETLVIVVDQFEELFTLGADAEERARFARELVLASGRDRVRVVITLRDDFLARAGELGPLRDRLAQGIALLATPAADDLLRIVSEPAHRAGYDFDEAGLPARMVRAVAGQPGALALLSFTAAQLWALRDRHFKRLTRKSYDALGGVEGALAAHADAVIAACTGEEQRLVRAAFRHLVTAEGTRAVLTRAELGEILGRSAAATAVVERLVQARLLVASEAAAADDEGGDRIELIHEALIGAWPRLAQWRRDDAEGARMRDQVRAAARQWADRGRARGLLWRDDALDDYRRWRARWPDALPETDQAFAAASLADAARGRRIRRALVASAAAILIGATVALSLLYRASERNATVAHDRLVASYVEQGRRLLLDGDYLRALPYLSAAYSEGEDARALRFMLHRAMALADTPVFRGQSPTSAAAFRSDGKTVLAIHDDGSAEVWEPATGRVTAALPPAAEPIVDARGDVSADGAVAAIPAKTSLLLWDGARTTTLPVVVARAAFDPSGTRLAVASSTELSVWDLRGATRRWGVAVDGPVSTLTWVGDAVLVRQRDDRAWLAQPAVTPLGQAARVGSAPTGALVLVGDGHVQVRTPDGGRHEIQSPEPNTVAFDARGAQLAVGGRNGVVQLFEVATGLLRGNFAGPVGAILQIRFSPDGALLATVTADQTLRIWDVARQRELSHRVGLGGTPLDLRYDAGGRRVVVAAADGSVRVFAVADPAAAVVLDAGEALGASHFVDGGRRVFTNSEAGVELWDATSGARLAQLTIASADGARLSEDGRVLALPRAADPVVEIRAGIDGPVRARIATAAQPGLVALDPGAARVVTTSDAAVDVWTIGGAHLAALVGHRGAVVDAAFCPDGTRIVTAGYDDQSARVWDAATGQQLGQVDATDSMNTAVFDTTCAHILTASEDRVARLWDARTFALVGSFEHASFLRAAAISPDGALVAGATGDGTLTLWDVASRQPIGSYKQGAYLVSVDFAPDGQRVLSASGDHHAIVWDIADAVPDPEVTRAFVDCHSPYRLRSTSLEVVVPATCVR